MYLINEYFSQGNAWSSPTPTMGQLLQHQQQQFTAWSNQQQPNQVRSPPPLGQDLQAMLHSAARLHERGVLTANQLGLANKCIVDRNVEMMQAIQDFDMDGGERLWVAIRRVLSTSMTGGAGSGVGGGSGNGVHDGAGGGSGGSFSNAPMISTMHSGSFVGLPGLPRLPSFGDLGMSGGVMGGSMGGMHNSSMHSIGGMMQVSASYYILFYLRVIIFTGWFLFHMIV